MPTDLLPYLTGPAGAVVVLVWVVVMQRQDIKELRKAVDKQTSRGDAAEEAGRAALTFMTSWMRGNPPAGSGPPPGGGMQ
jgi:hypothetical protein